MGLCLVAACAIFALSASSALAFENLPHYGQCNALSGGKYSNSGCTKLAKPGTSGTHEWVPLAKTVKFTSKKEKETGKAVLEAASGSEISCTEQVEKIGEYGPGENEVKNVVGEFSGCEALGGACTSEGQKSGLINTKKLHGEPGIVKHELNEEKNVDGNDLRGQESELLAEFSCSGAPVTVRGGVVVQAKQDGAEITNKMESTIEVEFVAEKPGKQVPSKWEPNGTGVSNSKHEEITENLEGNTAGKGYEASGQSLITDQKAATKVELRQCAKTIECKN